MTRTLTERFGSIAGKGSALALALMVMLSMVGGIGMVSAQTASGTELATTDSSLSADTLNQNLSTDQEGYALTEVAISGVTYSPTTSGETVNLTVTATDADGNVVGEQTYSGTGSDAAQNYTLDLNDGVDSPATITLSKSVTGGTATADSAALYGTTTGSVDVTATDADGNAVENASVEITDSNDTVVASGSTDANGTFSAADLEAGDYSVSITHADHPDATTDVTVNAGETTTADVSLTEGGGGFGTGAGATTIVVGVIIGTAAIALLFKEEGH